MNKENVLKVLTITIKVFSFCAGLAVYADKLPVKWAAIAVLAFGGASILKDSFTRIGDLLDDGNENNSFGK